VSATQAIQQFTEGRLAFSRKPGYAGGWVSDPEREAVTKAYDAKRFAEFLKLSEAWLRKCPVDARLHMMRAEQLSERDDPLAAAHHRLVFYGLLTSITSSGDGHSKESAYKVISVDEEYTVMNYLGAEMKGQRLQGNFDVIAVDLNGKEATLYFDVSIPMKAMSDRLKTAKEQP
jgi:hypothetical protein